jgi:hypothetical protein
VSGVAVAGLAGVLFLGGTRLERGGAKSTADGGGIGTAP